MDLETTQEPGRYGQYWLDGGDPDDNDQSGVTDPDAGGGPQGDDDDDDDQPVSREAFNARMQTLQDKIDELEDRNQLYKTQLSVYQGAGGGQQGPARAQNQDPFADREDDDVVTVAEMKQILGRLMAGFNASLGEVRTASVKTDYAEVVKTHLPNYLEANPEMIPVLKALPADQRPALAYQLGTLDPAYQAKKTKTKLEAEPNPDLDRINANKRKPQPGGKGGGGPLGKAQMYATMSDEELERTLARVKSGIG
jgi:hypothetical protein